MFQMGMVKYFQTTGEVKSQILIGERKQWRFEQNNLSPGLGPIKKILTSEKFTEKLRKKI